MRESRETQVGNEVPKNSEKGKRNKSMLESFSESIASLSSMFAKRES